MQHCQKGVELVTTSCIDVVTVPAAPLMCPLQLPVVWILPGGVRPALICLSSAPVAPPLKTLLLFSLVARLCVCPEPVIQRFSPCRSAPRFPVGHRPYYPAFPPQPQPPLHLCLGFDLDHLQPCLRLALELIPQLGSDCISCFTFLDPTTGIDPRLSPMLILRPSSLALALNLGLSGVPIQTWHPRQDF